ncbi:MAG: M20/M25/M40 family metallo-hydrolase [Bacteroidetes bacterium]|nr:MAG: M20/M25/M40 family metallo-hydrolase [Bacteroidota bacterium]
MRIKLVLLSLLFFGTAKAQLQPFDAWIQECNLDSLKQQVKNLTGVDTVLINGIKQTIGSRYMDQPGNAKAASYLKAELERFGYTTNTQSFSALGQNIIAKKTGSLYPDKAFFLTAHYDAIAVPFSLAIGADDNASGCAAVLEMARILQDKTLPYTVYFAFFDEEEQGLIGSEAYAGSFDFQGTEVQAVLNLDMIANDRNNDRVMELHARPYGNSLELAEKIQKLNDSFDIGLTIEIRNPGTTASDHSSFWDQGVTAILFIEDAQDFNPYYHTRFDSIQYFNDSFFLQNTQLALASLGWFGGQADSRLSTETALDLKVKFFPNPTQGLVYMELPQNGSISVYDAQGKHVQTETVTEGNSPLNLHAYQAGLYFVVYTTESGQSSSKRLILQP